MREYEEHPFQKLEALLKRIIHANSNKGNTVLNPFSGTFNTASIANNLVRKSISIESQDEYLKIGATTSFRYERTSRRKIVWGK